MKSVLHIIGLGESSLGELRLQSYRLLTEADRVFVISIKNKIVIEMLEEGIPCERVIADRDLADISNESEIFINYLKDKLFSLPKTEKVVLALPGNPLPEGKIISELRKNLVHFGLETGALEQKGSIERLVAIMAELRSERGCPWDREQDHLTLKKYLIEEAYEVIDAIDARNMNNFCEELGDLLLQVVFHARIAQENGKFSLPDIINGISEKLIRRHPHVFGSVVADSSAEVILNWDAIKGVEKGEISKEQDYFNIPSGLPALMFAHKTQKKLQKSDLTGMIMMDRLPRYTKNLMNLKKRLQKAEG